MGYRPPPNPISQKEWDRRVAAGATTWREIEPEFFEWLDRSRRSLRWSWLALCLAMLSLSIVAPLVGISPLVTGLVWGLSTWVLWRAATFARLDRERGS